MRKTHLVFFNHNSSITNIVLSGYRGTILLFTDNITEKKRTTVIIHNNILSNHLASGGGSIVISVVCDMDVVCLRRRIGIYVYLSLFVR